MPDVDVPSFFSDDPRGGALTYEQLQARRKIAAALATRNRPFPKTIGEGLTYLGESLGENYGDRKAAADEAAYRQQSQETVQRLLGPGAAAPAAAPVAAPAAASAGAGPMSADIDPFGGGFSNTAPQIAPTTVQPEDASAVRLASEKPSGMPIEEWKQRVARNESGGQRDPYSALGQLSRRGDRAYGKYQVMGENIPKWTKQFVGREMTPEEFLADKDAQETVATGMGGKYLAKYGPEGAAKAWFAGEKGMNDPNRKDTLGTHVAEYARRFNIPLVSREQVVASAAKIRPPEVLGEGEFNRIDAAAPDAGQAMAYAPEEPPPVQMASLGGAAPPPVDRGAIAQTIAGPPPQPAAQPPVQLAQAPQQQMPIGTRVPTGGAAQPSGPPRPPDPEPMSAREVQLRQAAGSSADPRIAGQLMPVIQQMEEARKAAYAVKLKQWEADLATYKSAQDPVHRANLERMQVEAAEKAKERAKVDARGGVPQSVIDEKLKESAKVAGPLREASGAINQIEDLLDQGIFTGTLGKFDLAAAKLKQAVGGAVDPRVARTEQFTSSIKPITAAARAALAGGANISDRDLQAAEAAAGGDITLTKEGIQRIMSSLRTIQLQTAMHHQGILETAAGGDTAAERTLYGLHGLPMENIISKNHPAVQRLMENADNEHERGLFDKAFHTPGLAERIIVKNKGR